MIPGFGVEFMFFWPKSSFCPGPLNSDLRLTQGLIVTRDPFFSILNIFVHSTDAYCVRHSVLQAQFQLTHTLFIPAASIFQIELSLSTLRRRQSFCLVLDIHVGANLWMANECFFGSHGLPSWYGSSFLLMIAVLQTKKNIFFWAQILALPLICCVTLSITSSLVTS